MLPLRLVTRVDVQTIRFAKINGLWRRGAVAVRTIARAYSANHGRELES